MHGLHTHGQKISHKVRGVGNGRAKLTEEAVQEIRKLPWGPAVALASKFKVDPSLISMIRNRKAWKHLP